MEEEKKAEKEAPKEDNMKKLEGQIAVFFIILVLIFASYLAFSHLFRPSTHFKFQEYDVYKTRLEGIDEDFYIIPVTDNKKQEEIVFRNDPRSLDLKVVQAGSLLNVNNIGAVWITMPNEIEADGIIAQNQIGMFTSTIGLKTEYGLIKENDAYPGITCDNATERTRVFMIELSNETRVYEEGNCVIVHGKNYAELVKASDSLVFYWLNRITVDK